MVAGDPMSTRVGRTSHGAVMSKWWRHKGPLPHLIRYRLYEEQFLMAASVGYCATHPSGPPL